MNKRLSVLAICLLALVCIPILPMAPAIAQVPSSVPVIVVHWNRDTRTENNVYEGRGEEWLFGESIKLFILDENENNIADKDYEINRGDLINFTLVIPTRFFDASRPLESVNVGANMGDENQSANLHLSYYAPLDEWHVFSSLYDMKEPNPPNSNEFFEFDTQLSRFITLGEYYLVNFVGVFNASAPSGIYHTYADAMDNASNFIHPSHFGTGPAGEFPLPPIALECSLDFMHGMWEKPPEYDIRILNVSYEPIQFAEAGDHIYFEFAMDQEIGFVAFEIGPVASFEQRQYLMNVTQWWPDDYCNPDTTWTTSRWEEPPRLGFFYNASAPPPNDIGAFIFYPNTSWVWRDYGGGCGGWESYADPIIDMTGMLPNFFNFNIGESQAIDAFTIKWKGSFTNLVCNRTEYPPHGPPKVTYGTTFHIWPHDLRFWGTQSIDGILADPSFDFMQSNGAVLALNDKLIEARITDSVTHELLESVDQDEWFTIEMDIHAPIEVINHTTGPYLADAMMNIWRNETRLLENISLSVDGWAYGRNETHDWNAYINIQFVIDVDTLSIVDQFCSMDNSTYRTYDWVLVDQVFTNTHLGLANLLDITNVTLNLGTDLSVLQFDARLVSHAPDGDYHFWDLRIDQNYIDQTNATGIWETFIFPEYHFLGGQVHWSPNFFILGNAMRWISDQWTVTEEGAVDLDGNLDTTDDQYYVKRVHHWHDEWNRTDNSLHVGIMFDPTATEDWGPDGDEFWSNNWMGLMTEKLQYQWNETFHWYHTDMTQVTAIDMLAIQDIVWQDITEQIPAPGYHNIAWMTVNRSWQDLLNEWWWLEDNTWEWSWFGFGTEQEFNLATDTTSTTFAHFRSEFAGLLLFIDNTTINGGNGVPDFDVSGAMVDSNELTHYFLIENIGRIEFTYPFNSQEDHGEEVLIIHSGFDEIIDFGVHIYDVNGTLFPVHSAAGTGIKGCWDYYESGEGLVGLDPSSFDYILSTATIDEMAFDVHYEILLPNTPENPDPNNNLIQIKVDQYIGDWTLHQFDNNVLQGRGLAIAYFGELGTSEFSHGQLADFSVDDTPMMGNNLDSQIGDMYKFGADGRTFAAVQMGGHTYEWGYDNQIYECGATAVPMGAFSAMFQSSKGTSISRWNVESTFFFMVQGFNNWGGHWINNDPSFGIYTTALNMVVGPPPSGGLPIEGILLVGLTILMILVIVIAMNVRRRKRSPARTTKEPVNDYWANK